MITAKDLKRECAKHEYCDDCVYEDICGYAMCQNHKIFPVNCSEQFIDERIKNLLEVADKIRGNN